MPPSSWLLSGFFLLQDTKLFREDGGWNLVGAVSQYWCSRMVWSEEEQCYHIKGTSLLTASFQKRMPQVKACCSSDWICFSSVYGSTVSLNGNT